MLNDTQCRNTKPKDKPYKLKDSNGLYLEIKPNGVKAWRYRFELREDGKIKESVFAIGDYASAPSGETPEEAKARRDGRRFTLAEARDERTKARALVKQGINPAQHRQLERIKRAQENATTFEAVAKEWLALKDWEEITKKRRLDMLTRVVFPTLGELPVKQVTPPLILGVLKKAAEKNGVSVMEEAKRTLFGIFELAAETFRVDANPVHQWREALPKNKTQHKRPLETTEIGQLLRDFDGHGGRHETLTAFRLMWLTLTRPREAVEAKWEEFDLNAAIWRIPAGRMKMRREHVVPLPTQAVEMLRALHGLTGRHAQLFPHRDDKTKPMATASFRQALNVLGWAGKYSPHATRTTGSTRLNEMGYTADWIERQLAHAEPNAVRRTYNHAEHLADRAKMMQQWADMLDTWKKGDNNVTPIRQAA
ncbi:MAG: integrase [Hydrogenophilales bacterium CG03_land_8_20_14_0_80_62_28]|nr:tyrosine-type recombinase/integrase [Betaproteobacteria bacterium]OIO79448.1 MAG: integrase [Hydrogenophilaceae bacterium CG1_02_62_390]PIV24128.1 MAG: integrase [Hydrogenophilales bacterium CG03_land_8_20_14_0_80_62_28]PIW37486.1 MAG: integrase [Hydrogenophilales bacterium CG15_BIG_FIL_POST_REV_8_21_14_020_62_31]PIW71539.1 MAG: integrase [Hydrogenophilales bacterium CG12_big_fil_rev_8_21_14_0_65_61_21]PIX01220.1 MAG: integrase [Hydrogenophilales bacterium CG_4_8_14_3_um_filter_62_83]PIY98